MIVVSSESGAEMPPVAVDKDRLARFDEGHATLKEIALTSDGFATGAARKAREALFRAVTDLNLAVVK
jgi:hypothetical protein